MSVLIGPNGVINPGYAILFTASGGVTVPPPPPPPPPAIPGITSSITSPGADGLTAGIYGPDTVFCRSGDVDPYARDAGRYLVRGLSNVPTITLSGSSGLSLGGVAGSSLVNPGNLAAGTYSLTMNATDGTTTLSPKSITLVVSPTAVGVPDTILLDTNPSDWGYKTFSDPNHLVRSSVGRLNTDFVAGGAAALALSGSGLVNLDAAENPLNPYLYSTSAASPLSAHYGPVPGVTLTYTAGGTAKSQPVQPFIAQEQPALVTFAHPPLLDFYAVGDTWGQLSAFSDVGVQSLSVFATDVPMTINAQGRPVISGPVVAGAGKHTTFRVVSNSGAWTNLTVQYDVGAGTVLADTAMTMAISPTLDNYVRNQVVGTPAVPGMSGPITWALTQEDTYTSIYGGGVMAPFVQDAATGRVSCTNPPPATNQGTGAHQVTGKLGPVRRPNGHIITLTATSGSVRCKRVFNVPVAWHDGPVIHVGRGMKAAHGALGEDTFEAGIGRFNRFYGGPSASDAGGTLLFYADSDPEYYSNSGMANFQLRQGIMGPVKLRWANPAGPRPEMGGTTGAAYMGTTNQKAFILVSNGDCVIEGLRVRWCHGYDNGHGQSNIRKDEDTYGDFTVIDCCLHDGDNGIEVGSGPYRFWEVRTVIYNCGSEYVGSGATHGVYASGTREVNFHDCIHHRVVNGHPIKSRAARTNVIDCRMYDGERGCSSNLIDAPYGGDLLVQNCDLQKGPNQQNPYAIQHGEEGEQYGLNNPRYHSVRLVNNRVAMLTPTGNHSGPGCVVSTADARSNIDGSGSSLTMTGNSIYLRPGDGSTVRSQSPYGNHPNDRQIVPQTETGTVLLTAPFALDFSDPTTGAPLPRPGPVTFVSDGTQTFENFYGVQIDVGNDDVRIPASSPAGTALTPGGRADGTALSAFMDPASPYGAPFGPGTTWSIVQDPQWSSAVPWAPVGRYGVTTNSDGTCLPKATGALPAAGNVDYFKLRATGPGGIKADCIVYVALT